MKIVKENSIAKAGPSQSEKTWLISLDGSKYLLPATVIEQVYDEETKKSLGVILEEIKQNAGGSGGSEAGGIPEMQVWKERNFFDLDDPPASLFVMIPDQAFAGPSEFTTGDTFKIMGQPVTCTLTSGKAIPDGYFQANSRVLMLYDSEQTRLWIIGSDAGSGPEYDSDGDGVVDKADEAHSIKPYSYDENAASSSGGVSPNSLEPRAPTPGADWRGNIYFSMDKSDGTIIGRADQNDFGETPLEVYFKKALDSKKINGKSFGMELSGTDLNISYV